MVNPVSTTNAIYTAREAMKAATNQLEDAANKVASGDIQAEKIAQTKKAELYTKVQEANMKSAMHQQENALDIFA